MGNCYYCRLYFSRFYRKLKLRHFKHHWYERLGLVTGDNGIFRFKNFQNLLLQSDKVELEIDAELMDVYKPSTPNRVKEHEAIAVSYGRDQRDSSNTVPLVGAFGKNYIGTSMITLIKAENKSVSRLCNENYPMTISR